MYNDPIKESLRIARALELFFEKDLLLCQKICTFLFKPVVPIWENLKLNHACYNLALSNDDVYLFAVDLEFIILQIDFHSGALVQSIPSGHSAKIHKLVVQGDMLITCSVDTTIRIFSFSDSLQCVQELTGHRAPILTIDVMNNFIASGARESGVRIWDLMKRKKLVRNLKGHENNVNQVAFVSDNLLVSAAWDTDVILYDFKKGKAIWTQTINAKVSLLCSVKDAILVVGKSKQVVLSMENGQILKSLEYTMPLPKTPMFQYDETRFLYRSSAQNFCCINVFTEMKRYYTVSVKDDQIFGFEQTRHGTHVVYIGTKLATIYVCPLERQYFSDSFADFSSMASESIALVST